MSAKDRSNSHGGARLQKNSTPKRPKKGGSAWSRLPARQKALRIAFLILTILAALVIVGFVAWHFLSAPPPVDNFGTDRPQVTTVIDEEGNEVEVEIPGLSAGRKDQFYTFLVVGQDTFGGGNTDTMMLGAYDVPNQKLSVMSLPRDTFVEYRGRKVLLNSVYNRAGGGEDGIKALEQEVGELTGVTPDYHVIVQWEAVGELVNAIGGVYFEVPFDMYYNDLSQDFKIDLRGGYQLLDGEKAMGLLRWRHNSIGDTGKIDYSYGYAEGDLGRIKTQQAFLTATLSKCLQPGVLLPNLMEYIQIFQNNVVTDLTIPNMVYFAKSAVGNLDMSDVQFVTMPNKSAGDGAHVLPIGSELLKLVNASFNPYEDDLRLSELKLVTSVAVAATPSPAPSGTPEPADSPVPPEPPESTPGDPLDPEPPVDTPPPSAVPSTVPGAAESPSVPATAPPEGDPDQPSPEPTPDVTVIPEPDPLPTPSPELPEASFGPGMEPVE